MKFTSVKTATAQTVNPLAQEAVRYFSLFVTSSGSAWFYISAPLFTLGDSFHLFGGRAQRGVPGLHLDGAFSVSYYT